jgi:hypothetical protein
MRHNRGDVWGGPRSHFRRARGSECVVAHLKVQHKPLQNWRHLRRPGAVNPDTAARRSRSGARDRAFRTRRRLGWRPTTRVSTGSYGGRPWERKQMWKTSSRTTVAARDTRGAGIPGPASAAARIAVAVSFAPKANRATRQAVAASKADHALAALASGQMAAWTRLVRPRARNRWMAAERWTESTIEVNAEWITQEPQLRKADTTCSWLSSRNCRTAGAFSEVGLCLARAFGLVLGGRTRMRLGRTIPVNHQGV